MKGYLKSLKADKGFGFIMGSNGVEYFFHRTSFNGHWNDLSADFDKKNRDPIRMNFRSAESAKGPRAEQVERLDNGREPE